MHGILSALHTLLQLERCRPLRPRSALPLPRACWSLGRLPTPRQTGLTSRVSLGLSSYIVIKTAVQFKALDATPRKPRHPPREVDTQSACVQESLPSGLEQAPPPPRICAECRTTTCACRCTERWCVWQGARPHAPPNQRSWAPRYIWCVDTRRGQHAGVEGQTGEGVG